MTNIFAYLGYASNVACCVHLFTFECVNDMKT